MDENERISNLQEWLHSLDFLQGTTWKIKIESIHPARFKIKFQQPLTGKQFFRLKKELAGLDHIRVVAAVQRKVKRVNERKSVK